MQVSTLIKHVFLWGLAGFGVLCLIVLLSSQWVSSPSLKHYIQSTLGAECSLEILVHTQTKNASQNTTKAEEVEVLDEIKRIVDLSRNSLREDLEGYMSDRQLKDLVIEENGQPVRSMIVSTWRSGTTFLGDILGSHPGNFRFTEPFSDFGLVKVRDDLLAAKAVQRIRALFNCDFADLQDNFLEFVKTRPFLLNASTHLLSQFGTDSVRYDHRYLSRLCKLFPYLSMKLTRIRLHVAGALLADENLSVKIVLLVRDPRGSAQSRKHLEFCQRGPDCSEPPLLCADLVADYKAAVKLSEKYPSSFRVLRYEDLAADPHQQVEKLYEFYGLDWHPNVKNFLDTHTTVTRGDSFSTFRNIKTTPYHWKTDLNFEEVEEIQQSCAAAMKYWGYVPAMNATHLREFNPVTNYSLKL